MNQLYFHQKYKILYYVSYDGVICDSCKDRIKEIVFIFKIWNKKKTPQFIECCRNCLDKTKDKLFGIVTELSSAVVTDVAPIGSQIIFNIPPELVIGKNRSVFEVAVDNSDGATIIDRTKLSGRESLEGATIGNPALLEELKKENDVLQIQLDTIETLESSKTLDLTIKQREHLERRIREEKNKINLGDPIETEQELNKLIHNIRESKPAIEFEGRQLLE